MSETSKATTLLLDMDGVLAEVSKSYRASIVQTCHAFGATSVTTETVGEWKARGGCNNDWVLSLDLIKEHAPPEGVTLEKVTETFESIYQGTATTPGLCALETLIPSKETLEELYKKCEGRMAIVTGRPRNDCDKFLKVHNIDHLFRAAVCMEDGPHKPDPFPVVRACELLGVEPGSAVIMVGDTPDDIRAGVAAGCRGVGVALPENAKESLAAGKAHDSDKLSVAMKECGAVLVMKPGFEELLEFF